MRLPVKYRHKDYQNLYNEKLTVVKLYETFYNHLISETNKEDRLPEIATAMCFHQFDCSCRASKLTSSSLYR